MMPAQQQPVPAISRLDASMQRCGVGFICEYRFQGGLDLPRMEQSARLVLSNIQRLHGRMLASARYQGSWSAKAAYRFFLHYPAASLEQGYQAIYAQQFALRQDHGLAPLALVVVTSTGPEPVFSLLLTGEHAVCDGAGASMVLNQLIAHYNAASVEDQAACQRIETSMAELSSPAASSIYRFFGTGALLSLPRWQHVKNTASLLSYKVKDAGGFATPYADIPSALLAYRGRPAVPLRYVADISQVLERGLRDNPALSSHILLYALVAQAFQRCSGLAQRSISFRIMVDILKPKMRAHYLGNYIAYLPISVDAAQPLPQLAADIGQHLHRAKQRGWEISMYKMLEGVLASGMATKVNDPTSFTVSSVVNYQFEKNPQYLHGASLQAMAAGASAQPADVEAAKLNNRPVVSITLYQKTLTLELFNSITDPVLGPKLLQALQTCLQEAG